MSSADKFTRDAIAVGWKPKHVDYQHICFTDISRDGETAVFNNCENDSDFNLWCEIELSGIMLDPAAWQAVGKVRGWGYHACHYFLNDNANVSIWKCKMHGLIDALVEGKTIEDYLASIE